MSQLCNNTQLYKVLSIIVFMLMLLVFPERLQAREIAQYPRTANYFLRLDRLNVSELARYDVVVIPAETQVEAPYIFEQLRASNPDIIILAYMPAQSLNDNWDSSLHNALKSGVSSSWMLRDPYGNQVSFPGFNELKIINVNTDWSGYISSFVTNSLVSNGYWDGVFYDMVDPTITWVNSGRLDVNRDGREDSHALANQLWLQGMQSILQQTRSQNPDKYIVMNGSSHPALQGSVNGRMFENFPTPWHQDGTWQANMSTYINAHDDPQYSPHIFIVNNNTNNTYDQTNYRRMRYGLTSALLGNGYYSFDSGDRDHGQLWWYDEYDTRLGSPLNGPVDIQNQRSEIVDGVWQREFEQGLVLVNSSSERKRVTLGQEYEKIHGVQDPYHNDGSIINRVYLEPQDGIILTKRQEELIGNTYVNGAFTRIFNQSGQNTKTGFFSFKSLYRSGSEVLVRDINNDGYLETIVASGNKITVTSNTGRQISEFYPYTRRYSGGVTIAMGDLNGDDTQEIITGTHSGGGPHVRLFDINGRALTPGFFPYNKFFRGGVNVAVCDTNGNGLQEIITGAGYGGGPHIRIFNNEGELVNPGFFAYSQDFRGGVNVGCGDVTGDGRHEIITGPGRTGGPHVKVFGNQGQYLLSEFFAYKPDNTAGIMVSSFDMDRDGRDEVIAQTQNYFGL